MKKTKYIVEGGAVVSVKIEVLYNTKHCEHIRADNVGTIDNLNDVQGKIT